jgi:ketosteroid isomerase-like protein
MDKENAQVVRGIYDAFGRGDIEALISSMAEDVSWNAPGAAPYSGRRMGRDQVRQFFADLDRAIQVDQFDIDELISERDKVVVLGRERATSKETGRHFEQEFAHAFVVRDGKIASVHLYDDTHAQASVFDETRKEREALTGSLGITHPAYSGRTGGQEF